MSNIIFIYFPKTLGCVILQKNLQNIVYKIFVCENEKGDRKTREISLKTGKKSLKLFYYCLYYQDVGVYCESMEGPPEAKKLKTEDEEKNKKTFPCKLCDYIYASKNTLKRHKEAKHEGIRYPCDQCEFSATRMGYLKEHKEAKHEGIRYPCDQCEYRSTEMGALKRHKEAKREGIRYPCDQCEFAATQMSNLKKH